MSKPFQIIHREPIYQGSIIEVVKDRISLPNGKETDREVVLHNGAAAVLPIDEEGNIIFVRQYRHPINEEILEIPAGLKEEDETPLEAAMRELEEETGYQAGKFSLLCEIYSAVGFCNEKISIYMAENLKQTTQNLDEDEFVSIEKYSLKDAVNMVFEGKIVDSKTVAAVLAVQHLMKKI